MRNIWAACAITCALIAAFPTRLEAQTSEPAAIDLAAWGPYARLADHSVSDESAAIYRIRWRWEKVGEVLLEEWWKGAADAEKPSYVMTIRLGPKPGTLDLKSSFLGKEWVGTVQGEGLVSFVGKGLLKWPYSIRVDEKGNFEQGDLKGNTYVRGVIVKTGEPVAAAEKPSAAPAPAAAAVTAPPVPAVPAVMADATPAPVTAKPAPASPPPKPIKAPRQLTVADSERIWQTVQNSRARSQEQARRAELQRQEAARQAELQARIWAAQEAQRQAEEAEADAEFEAERARKAAAWNQMARANEQALNDSLQQMRDTTARIQAQQAEAAARQREQAEAAERAERQRQVELIRQANQRQDDEAARLAAQRQQYEQQRADAQAAELQAAQRRRDEQQAQEAQRRREQQLAQETQRRRDEQGRQDAADRERQEQLQQQRRDALASLTRNSGAANSSGVSGGGAQPRKMCSHPESKVHLYEPKQDVEKEKARACGNIGRSITETGRKCDGIGWCSVDLVCGPWEAECPSGASAQ